MKESPQRMAARARHMRRYREFEREGIEATAAWIRDVQARYGKDLPRFPQVRLPLLLRKISSTGNESDG